MSTNVHNHGQLTCFFSFAATAVFRILHKCVSYFRHLFFHSLAIQHFCGIVLSIKRFCFCTTICHRPFKFVHTKPKFTRAQIISEKKEVEIDKTAKRIIDLVSTMMMNKTYSKNLCHIRNLWGP